MVVNKQVIIFCLDDRQRRREKTNDEKMKLWSVQKTDLELEYIYEIEIDGPATLLDVTLASSSSYPSCASLQNDDKKMENCDRFTQSELVYQSSEQYLILCLKICNLIIKNKCHIESLLELASSSNSSASSSIGHKKPASSSSTTTIFDLDAATNLSSLYTPAQLLSHLNETECAKYAHKESYKLSLFICGILLCLLILVLNSLTLITIVKTRRLHSITNILIANLSASDFLSGVAFLYPCILNLLTINALETYDSYLYTLACNIRQYYYLCLAGYSPMITSMLSSMLTLTLLAFEKYMAILHPYLYERIVNERRYVCYLSILVTWTVSILVSALPIMGWNEHNKVNKTLQNGSCFSRVLTEDNIENRISHLDSLFMSYLKRKNF